MAAAPFLIYVSEANLADRLALRDLYSGAARLGQRHPIVILHANVGDAAQTRFVTKRISAQVSEAMLANTALDGYARGLITQAEGAVQVDAAKLRGLLANLQGVVLNALATPDTLGDPEAVLLAFRQALQPTGVLLLPDNPLSPLGSPARKLTSPSDMDSLWSSYAEEAATLHRAAKLLPATILAPAGLGQVQVPA